MVVSGKQLELTVQKNLLLAAAAQQRLDSNAQPEAALKTNKSRRVSPCPALACLSLGTDLGFQAAAPPA